MAGFPYQAHGSSTKIQFRKMGKKKGTNGMMKKITKRLWEKKNSKKGFTLVELIVVLVILAILAAIMIPALTGWIGKAKEKQVALEARTVYLSAQTIASEEYAGIITGCYSDGKMTDTGKSKILELAELEAVADGLTVEVNASYKVTKVVYKSGSGYTATLSDGKWKYDTTTTTSSNDD